MSVFPATAAFSRHPSSGLAGARGMRAPFARLARQLLLTAAVTAIFGFKALEATVHPGAFDAAICTPDL